MGLLLSMARGEINNGEFAKAAVSLLAEHQDDPIGLWNWLKRGFGRRRDYGAIAQGISDALVGEYHERGKIFRRLVARAFGKPGSASRLGTAEFCALVRRSRRPVFPWPRPWLARPETPRIDRLLKRFRFSGGSVDARSTLDLRKDAAEFRRLLTVVVDYFAAACGRMADPPLVSAIDVGFSVGQEGWVAIHFDMRPIHLRDGSWSASAKSGWVMIPAWRKARTVLQERGGTVILPGRKKVVIRANAPDGRVAGVYGEVIQSVLLRANRGGVFGKLPLRERCQLDVEEFDGNWAWPRIRELGKTNLVGRRRR